MDINMLFIAIWNDQYYLQFIDMINMKIIQSYKDLFKKIQSHMNNYNSKLFNNDISI